MPRGKIVYWLLIFGLFSSLAFGAAADPKFKDMDDKHWAAKSVYNCVRLGITKGFPDGTFRGETQINRYELMVFLNNLAITLEKMMDDKLEDSTYANEEAVSSRALEELKTEIQTLREEQLAQAAGGESGSKGKGGLKSSIDLDTYMDERTVFGTFGANTYTNNEYWIRLRLGISRELGYRSFFHLGLDTAYLPWGETTLMTSDVFYGDYQAGKKINDWADVWFRASLGPGQKIMGNKKVLQGNDDALVIGSRIFGVNLETKLAVMGITSNYDINHDGNPDNLRVNLIEPSLNYTLPFPVPYLGRYTVGYAVDQYTTEFSKGINDLLRTTRYIQSNTFVINDKLTWEARLIKEIAYRTTLDSQQQHEHHEQQSRYYDTRLIGGDFFNSGTTWELMYSVKETGFGSNGLLEKKPAANLLGYDSSGYFSNDWQNSDLTPSADVVTESGVKIVQSLLKEILFLNLVYISGTAVPDSDKNDNTKYAYKMWSIGLDWRVNPDFTAYLSNERKELDDSTINNAEDQYSDSQAIFGARVHF